MAVWGARLGMAAVACRFLLPVPVPSLTSLECSLLARNGDLRNILLGESIREQLQELETCLLSLLLPAKPGTYAAQLQPSAGEWQKCLWGSHCIVVSWRQWRQ